MSNEQIYKLMKEQEYLPGSMRWRVGSLNEHEDRIDTTRFVTPDGRAFVVEYVVHEDASKTYSDVFDITEIDPKQQMIRG